MAMVCVEPTVRLGIDQMPVAVLKLPAPLVADHGQAGGKRLRTLMFVAVAGPVSVTFR